MIDRLLGEAVAQVMGKTAGHFTTTYQAALDEAAEQSIEGVPVIEALVTYVKRKGSIESTVGKLFDSLTYDLNGSKPSAWPKSAKGFRDSLNRFEPAMRLMGVQIEYPPKGKNGRPIHIFFSEQNKSTEKTPSRQSPPSARVVNGEGGDGYDSEIRKELFDARKEKVVPSTVTLVSAPLEIQSTATEGWF